MTYEYKFEYIDIDCRVEDLRRYLSDGWELFDVQTVTFPEVKKGHPRPKATDISKYKLSLRRIK